MGEAATAAGAATPAVTAKSRNATIDGLKYVAAAGIVMHHVAANVTSPVGAFFTATPLWALFFFFAASGYFHGAVGNRGSLWLRKRVVRLGVPYAFWTVFYLIWNQRGALHGVRVAGPSVVDVVFFGGANGILWSLAVLIYLAVATEMLVTNDRLRRVAIVVTSLITLAMYWTGGYAFALEHARYFNFLLASRYALAYLAGMEVRAAGPRTLPAWVFQTVAAGCILGVGAVRLVSPHIGLRIGTTVETVLWIAAAVIILRGAATDVPWFGADRLAWGRDFLIGVYVTHVIFLGPLVSVLPVGSLPGVAWILTVWAACLLCATALVALLRSTRLTRLAVT